MKAYTKYQTAGIALILGLCTNVQAALMPMDLGLAGDFNTFVLGDMKASHSDVEGRLAVGGNLELEHYAIGMELDPSHGNKDNLIAGGNLNFSDGRVYHGNARSGGDADLERVGFYNDDPRNRNAGYKPGNPINFTKVGRDLKKKSSEWGSQTANGTSTWDNGFLTLTGLDAGLNIFSLSADLLDAHTFWLDIPEQSWALINVFGASVSMDNFGFFRTVNGTRERVPDNAPPHRHDNDLTQKVLFNLIDATFLELYSIGLKGSLLAPLADLIFYDGHIDGNLIVGSLQGKEGEHTGQVNHYPLISPPKFKPAQDAVPIPEPPSFQLFIAALISLMLWSRRARITV